MAILVAPSFSAAPPGRPTDLTPIYVIQGRAPVSPLAGQRVITEGAVTRVDDDGFFLQDLAGDGDPLTSDAIFVYTGLAPETAAATATATAMAIPIDSPGDIPSARGTVPAVPAVPAVRVGQCVRVAGRVVEFDVGGVVNATGGRTVTELHETTTRVLRDGCTVAPVDLSLPLPPGADLRAFEGMLVALHGPFTVQQNYFLGRFGQLTLAVGGRAEAPTNRLRPGPSAQALADAQARRSLLLEDRSAHRDPSPPPFLGPDGTVRAGDVAAGIVGVIDYGPVGGGADAKVNAGEGEGEGEGAGASGRSRGAWKIYPVQPVVLVRANPRPAVPPDVGGGRLKVAAANVDNFFTTIANASAACAPGAVPSDCRGARSAEEFELQRDKLVAELAALDADIIGLMEIENNGATALQSLVDALNRRAGAPTWAAIADPPQGSGGDAIKVALIYRPARVRPVGRARSDTAAVHNRFPLAQTFAPVAPVAPVAPDSPAPEAPWKRPPAARLTVIVSHFKSRRCDGASGLERDRGDLQGCWNHRRIRQARALLAFVADVRRRSGVADTLLVGDFNAYAREDPIELLTSHGFVDQIARFDRFGYSYVFDGLAGRLDQVLASAALSAQVTGAAEWHVNADEPSLLGYAGVSRRCARLSAGMPSRRPTPIPACVPGPLAATPWRASDHDPSLVGVRWRR